MWWLVAVRALVVTVAGSGLLACAGPGGPAPPQPDLSHVSRAEPVEPRPVLVDLIERLSAADTLRQTTVIEPGDPDHRGALQRGWGRPEVHGKSGRRFAWVAAEEAWVELITMGPGAVTISVTGWPFHWRGASRQRMELLVNGYSCGARRMRRGRSTFEVTVPAGVLRPGRNRLVLRFARADAPADVIAGSTDGRTLAAAIERIAIERDGETDLGSEPWQPLLSDGVLSIPAESAITYRLVPRDAVALDLELAGAAGQGGTQPRVTVWVRPLDADPVTVVAESLSPAVLKRRVPLGEYSGTLVEIGIGMQCGTGRLSRAQLVGDGRVDSLSNLLLIVVDTLRADFVGAYGGEVSTPTIDGLAARGVLLERAYANIPITGPSHTSLFTSLLPYEHGVVNNGQITDGSATTLAETLRDAGWSTAAAVSLGVLKREYGLQQGFDVYLDSFERDWMKDARELSDEVLAMVDKGLAQPYFLWAHYSDPHEPYTPPDLPYPVVDMTLDGRRVAELVADGRGNLVRLMVEPGRQPLAFIPRTPTSRVFRVDTLRVIGEGVRVKAGDGWETGSHPTQGAGFYLSRLPAQLELVNNGRSPRQVELDFGFKEQLRPPEIRERYRREVEFADRQIGKLLAELEQRGLLDETIVVLTADHGEGLGQHGQVGHIHQVYDNLLRIPLIITTPSGRWAGLRVDEPVSLVDLFPTLADLLGVKVPANLSGRSVVPLLDGLTVDPRPIIAETYRPEAHTDKRAILSGGCKLIRSWSDEREWEELYDLEIDPDELNDLIDERPQLAGELRSALEEQLRLLSRGQAREVELSQQERDRLQALGYTR